MCRKLIKSLMLHCCVYFVALISLAHFRYSDRLRERLQEFAVRMSSVSQIYFHILNSERQRVKMLPCWRRVWCWKKSRQTMFMEALATMSDVDIVKITEQALGYRLPQFDGEVASAQVSSPSQTMASEPASESPSRRCTSSQSRMSLTRAPSDACAVAPVEGSFHPSRSVADHASSFSTGNNKLQEVVVHTSHVSIAWRDEPQSPCISSVVPSSADADADVPLQTEPAVADVDSVFVQKVDARSGRLYWLDLSTGLTSWIPPSGWKMQSTNFQSDRVTAVENKNIRAEQVDTPHLSHPQMLQRDASRRKKTISRAGATSPRAPSDSRGGSASSEKVSSCSAVDMKPGEVNVMATGLAATQCSQPSSGRSSGSRVKKHEKVAADFDDNDVIIEQSSCTMSAVNPSETIVTSPRALVSSSNSMETAIHNSAESKNVDDLDSERLATSCGFALPDAIASLQPQKPQSTHSSTLKPQDVSPLNTQTSMEASTMSVSASQSRLSSPRPPLHQSHPLVASSNGTVRVKVQDTIVSNIMHQRDELAIPSFSNPVRAPRTVSEHVVVSLQNEYANPIAIDAVSSSAHRVAVSQRAQPSSSALHLSLESSSTNGPLSRSNLVSPRAPPDTRAASSLTSFVSLLGARPSSIDASRTARTGSASQLTISSPRALFAQPASSCSASDLDLQEVVVHGVLKEQRNEPRSIRRTHAPPSWTELQPSTRCAELPKENF
jgi:hypothetical protein